MFHHVVVVFSVKWEADRPPLDNNRCDDVYLYVVLSKQQQSDQNEQDFLQFSVSLKGFALIHVAIFFSIMARSSMPYNFLRTIVDFFSVNSIG